jgi:hypothetical protein
MRQYIGEQTVKLICRGPAASCGLMLALVSVLGCQDLRGDLPDTGVVNPARTDGPARPIDSAGPTVDAPVMGNDGPVADSCPGGSCMTPVNPGTDGGGPPDPCATVDCGLHGSCGAGGNCTCRDGYSGNRCQTPADMTPPNPCATVDCGLHGSCGAGGNCTCRDGYTGERCQTVPDPCAGIDCGAHGSCAAGSCTCRDGYSGNRCQTDPCAGIDCGSHGSCSGGSCNCRDGYSGNRCQNAPDPCAGISCGAHGSCSGGTCRCRDGFGGNRCQTPCVNANCNKCQRCNTSSGACENLSQYPGGYKSDPQPMLRSNGSGDWNCDGKVQLTPSQISDGCTFEAGVGRCQFDTLQLTEDACGSTPDNATACSLSGTDCNVSSVSKVTVRCL